jgi:hypothetical protein
MAAPSLELRASKVGKTGTPSCRTDHVERPGVVRSAVLYRSTSPRPRPAWPELPCVCPAGPMQGARTCRVRCRVDEYPIGRESIVRVPVLAPRFVVAPGCQRSCASDTSGCRTHRSRPRASGDRTRAQNMFEEWLCTDRKLEGPPGAPWRPFSHGVIFHHRMRTGPPQLSRPLPREHAANGHDVANSTAVIAGTRCLFIRRFRMAADGVEWPRLRDESRDDVDDQ